MLDRAASRHTMIIAQFEALLEANPDRPLRLAEICAAIGISDKTLLRCCHKYLAMSPVRYGWLRRMNLAHDALVRADPKVVTVTEIANDHGFPQLGQFSVNYRTLFGEAPSKTLHRTSTSATGQQITGEREQNWREPESVEVRIAPSHQVKKRKPSRGPPLM